MGFESFRVELRGGSRTHLEVNQTISEFEQVTRDRDAVATPESVFFILNDGKHVIEIESIDAPVKISCRFTLCHPPAMDAFFLGFMRHLMTILDMEARICDDVPKEDSRFFPIGDFSSFSAAATRCIASRRREWVSAFGPKQMAATTNEAHARMILPHCQPGINS